MSLVDSLDRTIGIGPKSDHGALPIEEIKSLPVLPHKDTVLIDVGETPYTLNNEDFIKAIQHLRGQRYFRFTDNFPYLKHEDPNIQPISLGIKVDVDTIGTKASELMAWGATVPLKDNTFDYSTQRLSFVVMAGTEKHAFNLPTSSDLYHHFRKGLKIRVWVNEYGNLVYLPSHLAVQYREWLEASEEFDLAKSNAHKAMQLATKTEIKKGEGLLEKLPCDVLAVYKMNLRHLSEGGSGESNKANTVTHIGRVRGGFKAHSDLGQCAIFTDLLCGQDAKFEHGLYEESVDYSAKTWQETGITCKRCIAQAKRILKEHENQE